MLSKLWNGFIFLIIIGMVGLGINTIFGYQTVTFMYRVRINDIWIWKYDIWSYLEEIKNALTDTSRLELAWQTRVWDNDATLGAIGNNIAYLVNVIIFAINVLMYPFRIGAYALQILGSIIGLPVLSYQPENALAWLFQTTEFLCGLQIPYV